MRRPSARMGDRGGVAWSAFAARQQDVEQPLPHGDPDAAGHPNEQPDHHAFLTSARTRWGGHGRDFVWFGARPARRHRR